MSLTWRRIQVVVRIRADGPATIDPTRIRLSRVGHGDSMPPTRATTDGRDLVLRFNVMQGPGQQPLEPGDWALLSVDERGRRGPLVVTGHPALDAPDASVSFPIGAEEYAVTPTIDARNGSFVFRVRLRTGPMPVGDLPSRGWALRSRFARILRPIRTGVFRALVRLFSALAPRNGRRILFTSDSLSELSGNLRIVYDRMVERGLDRRYDLQTLLRPSIAIRRSPADRFRLPWLFARADVILLDNYQPSIYWLEDPRRKIIQLWHASGAFKTVGYSRIGKPGGPKPYSRTHKNYTRAIVSSDYDVEFYAEAFGIPEERVVSTGIPRMDRYFDERMRAAARALSAEAYPESVGRTVILFAPTFRGTNSRNASYDVARIDYAGLHALCVEKDAVVIIRLHPFVREEILIPDEYRDRLLAQPRVPIDVNDLLFAVDVLITDYSSIVFEYSVLGRPMLFYAYDLEEYVAERDFYVPFEEFVPGRVVRTFDELIDAIRRDDYEADKVPVFAERHFAHLDGGSTDRVIDELILAD